MSIMPKDWIVKGRALFIKEKKVLILSDIHFGKFNILESDYTNISNRIKRLIENFNPKILVLNGDIWNQFPFDEESIVLLSELQTKVDELIIIEGNHEEKCGGFTIEINNEFKTMKEYKIDDILIHHGHHTPTEKANHHVIGHIHPTINGNPVYLHSDDSYYGSSVTILPAFSTKINGNDINTSYNYAGHCPLIHDGKDINQYKFQSIN